MSIQPNQQQVSDLQKQMGLQNLIQGNNNAVNGNGNANQSFDMFQNRMSAQSNGKMSIDSLGFNQNPLACISGMGNGTDMNNISPDKSLRDSFRNNSLLPSQIERKTIERISIIENRLSEDQFFDIGLNNQRCSLEDTLQMTSNRNSQFQSYGFLQNNALYQSNRNSTNGYFGRFSSQTPGFGSMYNNNNMFQDDKLILQSNNAKQQILPQSYRINVNQYGFSNPQYITTQTVTQPQMQSIIGENALADSASMGTQNNSASAMSLEYQNLEKAVFDQLEQPNRPAADVGQQFAITSSTNQVTYPSSVSAPTNFYNLNAPAQNVNQSQFRFASGLSTGNSGVPIISVGVAQSQANLLNMINQTTKSTMGQESTNIFGNDASTLKLLQQQQQQQQQQLQRQILLSSGSGMIDIGAMTFGGGTQQPILQQQLNGQQTSSFTTAASSMGMNYPAQERTAFDPLAAMLNVKSENVGENEGNDSDKTEKGGQKNEKEQKRQLGGASYPSITRGAAFTTKQEVYSDDLFNSMLNPFEENNPDRQYSITNDNINKLQQKMSIASNPGINRSLNIDTKKENESMLFNDLKQEKDSLGRLSELGSAFNLQNNNMFNMSGFTSGANLSIQRGSNLANFKNIRSNLISRLSNGTNRNSDQTNQNRISFPTFDYDQKQFLESNGIAIRDQNGNFIVGQSNRSSAMNSESIVQDDENEKKKKGEEIIACNCGKTRCLKLYCVCFQQGLMCSDQCRCSDCYNRIAYLEERERAIKAIKLRYPDAFEKKVNFLPELAKKIEDSERLDADQELQNQLLAHKKGCNCKKSACKKKYCECYLAGVKCTYLCRCEQCQNGKNDGPENQGQHINIEGHNFVDQENYNKGNVVSIKTQNNAFGNIKLEVFRPNQQQFITKIERNSNQQHGSGGNNEDHRNINMENDDFNGDKLNHSRFTYSELENHFTQRKKQKNNEDMFDSMSQEKQQTDQFDQVFNQNNSLNQHNQENIDQINNSSNNNNNTLTDEDIQKLREQQENSILQHQQQQQLQQFMRLQQLNGNNNNNVNNNNFNDFQNNKNQDYNLKIETQQENNGFDFSSFNQNNSENGISQRKNMQFINMKRGTADDNEFMAN